VRILVFDQEPGVLALGVERIRGDDRPCQVQGLQQRPERRHLVGLPVDLALAEHQVPAGVDDRQ
jgi:hypothetical protein